MIRQFWTRDEDRLLRACYADTATTELAELLGRKIGMVYQRAAKLGLAKSGEFFETPEGIDVRRKRLDVPKGGVEVLSRRREA